MLLLSGCISLSDDTCCQFFEFLVIVRTVSVVLVPQKVKLRIVRFHLHDHAFKLLTILGNISRCLVHDSFDLWGRDNDSPFWLLLWGNLCIIVLWEGVCVDDFAHIFYLLN